MNKILRMRKLLQLYVTILLSFKLELKVRRVLQRQNEFTTKTSAIKDANDFKSHTKSTLRNSTLVCSCSALHCIWLICYIVKFCWHGSSSIIHIPFS